MSKRLSKNLSSRYLEAAQRMRPQKARQKITAFVESYDDVFFWSTLLHELETEDFYFEIVLPSRTSLSKGKKIALVNVIGEQLGGYMIACVDADYDYLMQGRNDMSRFMLNNPYVFHTYAYAIENYQCYAPTLHDVCVMATLNDKRLFDFEQFMKQYSQVVWPLFVWSIWCYRNGLHRHFSMADLASTALIDRLNYYHPEEALEKLRHRVNRKINQLQHMFPQAKKTYVPLRHELLDLGLTPETTYMYMRGHDLFDGLVAPLVSGVAEMLRREREREIRKLAEHNTQMQNELSAYQHAAAPIEEMLRKHTYYKSCPLFKKIQNDIRAFLVKMKVAQQAKTTTAGPMPQDASPVSQPAASSVGDGTSVQGSAVPC